MAKFTVVTVCRNATRYIEETIKSVLSQSVFLSGQCELEYLVCDGASMDGTLDLLPFAVQQESTVWRRSLQACVDFQFLQKLRLAGDAYLWKCFASVSELCIVRGHIGGYRVHRGQLSERLSEYREELRSFSRAPSAIEHMRCLADRLFWTSSERVKFWGNRSTMIVYDHARQAWRRVP